MAENQTVKEPGASVLSGSELETKISDAITQIKNGQSPKSTGIGVMFRDLKTENPTAYQTLFDKYKQVAVAVNAVKKVEENVIWQPHEIKPEPEEAFRIIKNSQPAASKSRSSMQEEIDRQTDIIMQGLTIDENTDPDSIRIPVSKRGPIERPGKNIDKVRVAKVKPLKPKRDPNAPIVRDRTAYKYRGSEYGKGQLVLAILRQHMLDNPSTTHDQLKKVFPDELLRGYGIFKKYEDALNMSKTRKRYFLKDDQQVKLGCGAVVCVSNQFTSDNILAFLEVAKKLGHKIG